MNDAMNDMTALGGTLIRWAVNTWAWADHTPAPEVTDMTLSWLHNFRCRTYGDGSTWVEVPTEDAKANEDLHWVLGGDYATSQSGDDTGERRIHADGRMTRATTRPGGKAIRDVYLVPLADWDARPPCGARWNSADEQAILTKAKSLGWRP